MSSTTHEEEDLDHDQEINVDADSDSHSRMSYNSAASEDIDLDGDGNGSSCYDESDLARYELEAVGRDSLKMVPKGAKRWMKKTNRWLDVF